MRWYKDYLKLFRRPGQMDQQEITFALMSPEEPYKWDEHKRVSNYDAQIVDCLSIMQSQIGGDARNIYLTLEEAYKLQEFLNQYLPEKVEA